MEKYQYNKLWHDLVSSKIEQSEQQVNGSKGDVVVKAYYSLISLGTEKLLTTQRLKPSTYDRMKVPYLEGIFGKKFTYGYSMVGEVLNGPVDMKGKLVHVMHPHQEMAFVNRDDVYVIPEMKDIKAAILASNLETAINALWDAGYSIGDKVLIVGYGMIGALIAAIINQYPVANFYILEKEDYRNKVARSHGYNVVNDPNQLHEKFDIVFNASGNQEGLQLGIDKAALEGKVLELSWYGSKSVQLNLGDTFHYNRVRIISSQVSHLPSCKSGNWDYQSRKDLVFDILRSFDLSYLITKEVPFQKSPQLYDDLRAGKIKDIGVALKY